MNDYRAKFLKDPLGVTIDLSTLKSGLYLVEGDAGEETWKKACKRMKVPHAGKFHAKLEFVKRHSTVDIKGTINATLSRECTRTLEKFDLDEKIDFEEKIEIETAVNDCDEAFSEEQFSIGSYLIQQLLINMEPYPVHPETLTSSKGDFGLEDGLIEKLEEEKEKKNPFSVLKNLKLDE